MKYTRFLCMIMALIAVFTLIGCDPSTPEETTEQIEVTDAPTAQLTESEATEPAETEPKFPEYTGPAADFKFTLESVLGDRSYDSYTDFVKSAEKSYLIPALGQQMIPQGMDIWEERGWLVISGYFPNTDISDCSVLVAIDMISGAYVGEYYLTNTDGTPHSSHAGGVAITDKNIYISNGSKLYRIPLAELLKAGQCGKVTIADEIWVPVRASFCNYSGGYLWVGDFQYGTNYPTDEFRHLTNREGKTYRAWAVGYELDDNTENGIKEDAIVKDSFATPDVVLSITERIQGMAVSDGKIVLSQSYGRSNKSTLFMYDNPIGDKAHAKVAVNGVSVPVYFLDSKLSVTGVQTPPMTEGLAYADGKLYILFESGADKYANGGGKDPTENVWTMIID